MSAVRRETPCAGVEVLTLSNPERRGALDLEALAALAGAVRATEARAIVVRGEAPAFSSGYDLRSLPPTDDDSFVEAAEALVAGPDHDIFDAIESSPATVIAAIDGVALGGGLELALTCDLRIAATRSRFAMPARDLGLVYSHAGVRRFLRACGETVTAELFLGARSYDAPEALGVGIVGEVVGPEDLDRRSLEVASAAAAAPAPAMRDNKRLIRVLGSPPSARLEDELRALRSRSLAGEEFRARVGAFRTRGARQSALG
jgi:enoyl-CoA hydratase/carnithine racemase